MAFSRVMRTVLTGRRVMLPYEVFFVARDNNRIKRFDELVNMLDVFSRNILL
jgi:hypothetical protein